MGRYVEKGVMDVDLFKLYEKVMFKADTLLNIFKVEKKKRGQFTYQKLPQANKDPADESLENAKLFFKNMYGACGLE